MTTFACVQCMCMHTCICASTQQSAYSLKCLTQETRDADRFNVVLLFSQVEA